MTYYADRVYKSLYDLPVGEVKDLYSKNLPQAEIDTYLAVVIDAVQRNEFSHFGWNIEISNDHRRIRKISVTPPQPMK